MKKQLPIDAPTNGTMILAMFRDEPTPLAATWNASENLWAVAYPQTDISDGEWCDTFFDTEYLEHEDMEWWCEIPDRNMD